mmetsp:Transcript_4836/g.9338  ORF Transcript_4836/g.9338 Transcript_4836/m.9338 type:complete len:239 (+) Transcript_4836:693-1409(+)
MLHLLQLQVAVESREVRVPVWTPRDHVCNHGVDTLFVHAFELVMFPSCQQPCLEQVLVEAVSAPSKADLSAAEVSSVGINVQRVQASDVGAGVVQVVNHPLRQVSVLLVATVARQSEILHLDGTDLSQHGSFAAPGWVAGPACLDVHFRPGDLVRRIECWSKFVCHFLRLCNKDAFPCQIKGGHQATYDANHRLKERDVFGEVEGQLFLDPRLGAVKLFVHAHNPESGEGVDHSQTCS